MSELNPPPRQPATPKQPVRRFTIPPPPPVVLEPIPAWKWVGAILLFLGFVAGSITFLKWTRKQSNQAEAAVTALHQKMIAADDAGIFADADPTYRQTVTAETSNGLFDNVRTRLGAPRYSSQTDSHYSNEASMGTFMTLHYSTMFDRGSGKETICFHNLNGVWKLAAYNVESPLLRTVKPAIRLKPKPSP